MSTRSRPSTPVASTPSTPQTGTWQHPKFHEIARRQNAASFSDRNVQKVLFNSVAAAFIWVVANIAWDKFPSLFLPGKLFQPYATLVLHGSELLFVYNIAMALLPLIKKDDISDIPLTPGQRKLLGLQPSSAPPTPGSQYATPPKYARTPTPMSNPSPTARSIYSDSPLSGKGSPAPGALIGSPFSPSASPLLHKAMGGGINLPRKQSYGSNSPLGMSISKMGLADAPSTPSPSGAKGASVGLNNRWLYEKGRRNSGSSRLFS